MNIADIYRANMAPATDPNYYSEGDTSAGAIEESKELKRLISVAIGELASGRYTADDAWFVRSEATGAREQIIGAVVACTQQQLSSETPMAARITFGAELLQIPPTSIPSLGPRESQLFVIVAQFVNDYPGLPLPLTQIGTRLGISATRVAKCYRSLRDKMNESGYRDLLPNVLRVVGR